MTNPEKQRKFNAAQRQSYRLKAKLGSLQGENEEELRDNLLELEASLESLNFVLLDSWDAIETILAREHELQALGAESGVNLKLEYDGAGWLLVFLRTWGKTKVIPIAWDLKNKSFLYSDNYKKVMKEDGYAVGIVHKWLYNCMSS